MRRCKTMKTQRCGKLLSRTCRNNRNSCYFSPGDQKFCRQKGPRFGVQKRTPKWRPLLKSHFVLLVSGRLGPRFKVHFWSPKRGPYCRQNFCCRTEKHCNFRFFLQVCEVLHTAGPLGFHGFTAPRAIVLDALQTFMPTHVLELERPTLATLESTAFLALGLGPSTDKIFARVVIRLAASHCS